MYNIKRIISIAIASMLLILAGCSVQFETDYSSQIKPESVSNVSAEPNNTGDLKVIFIDIGQGSSQLLTMNGKTILIDGGNNGQEEVMFKLLKENNIKKIDVLIGSHFHSDHIGTLPEIIDAFEIGSIYLPKDSSNTKTYEHLLSSIKNKGLKVKTAKSGVVINVDDALKVEILAPHRTYSDSNNMSAVVKVTYDEVSVLMPGDVEYESEQDMVNSGDDLASTILAVAHHGANTSSNSKFLQKVNPKYAVIQVGADNEYGHPTKKTLKKLENLNLEVFRTDQQGTITFTTDGKTVNVQTEK